MNDMRATIIPKSDQINADDLIGRTMTIKITHVSISAGEEQPVTINYEDDQRRPYRPCKSMRRVLVSVWGPDANAYVGRSMTLFRDGKAKFGGMEVGGIRISHMSHLQSEMTMALTVTKANKKPFTVKPLLVEHHTETKPRTRRDFLNELQGKLNACHTTEEIDVIAQTPEVEKAIASFTNGALDELNAMLVEALDRVNQDRADEPVTDEVPL